MDDGSAWERSAACHGQTALFFAERNPEKVAEAKAVCASCPVWEPCLDAAIRLRSVDGIWGGQTPDERRRLIRDVQRAQRRQDEVRRALETA